MTHPSNWQIKRASSEKYCQTLSLPLGPSMPSYRISVQLFNKISEMWGSVIAPSAGSFAQALRELRLKRFELRDMIQVNARMVDDCYDWLDIYELKLVAFGKKRQEEDKAIMAAPEKAPATPPEMSVAYDQIFLIAVKEYVIMAGPMGDAKQIAEKAKAVATACMGE